MYYEEQQKSPCAASKTLHTQINKIKKKKKETTYPSNKMNIGKWPLDFVVDS